MVRKRSFASVSVGDTGDKDTRPGFSSPSCSSSHKQTSIVYHQSWSWRCWSRKLVSWLECHVSHWGRSLPGNGGTNFVLKVLSFDNDHEPLTNFLYTLVTVLVLKQNGTRNLFLTKLIQNICATFKIITIPCSGGIIVVHVVCNCCGMLTQW